MLKTYSLYTSEADIPEAALNDIQQQLQAVDLLRNTVGIIICHPDYADSGVISLLKKELPFKLIGITTFYQANPKKSGLFELTITILTSDDVCFAVGCSSRVAVNEPELKIKETYQAVYNIYKQKPACILSFPSSNRPITGDEYLRLLDDASGGVPSFGVVNTGEDDTGEHIYIICDGETFSNGIAMLLLIGDVHTEMYVSEAMESCLMDINTTVTKAEGIVVKELNGQPAVGYLRKHGVILDDRDKDVISTIPFFCRMPGEEKLVGRALQSFNEKGEMTFMAEFPEGSLLRIGTVTANDILEESYNVTKKAVGENPDAAIFLIGSCVGRFVMLGLDSTSEIDHIIKAIPNNINYIACYAGGEICPVRRNDRLLNRYHNNSFIICALY